MLSRKLRSGKSAEKSQVFAGPLRYLINGCARGAELTVAAPLNLASPWSRILRLSTAVNAPIDDFLKVMLGQADAGI